MRVLYIGRAYTTHDRRFLLEIAARHETHYLRCTSDPDRYERRPLPDGVHPVAWPRLDPELGPLDAVQGAPLLERVLASVRPDIVHAGPVQSCGLMAVLARARPLIVMSWGSDVLVDADRDELWSWATRYTLAGADLFACDSEAVAARARSLTAIADDRIVRFPWGVDIEAFGPGPDGLLIRERHGWTDAVVALCTRSLEPLYGVDVLIDAIELARRDEPRLRLLLAGDGSQGPEVDRRIRDRGLDGVVARLGPVPNDELPAVFRAADLYVSASRADGTSVSMLEAMATGLPVIVSDIPGDREWVRPGVNGWLVPPGRPDSFAAAMTAAAQLTSAQRRAVAEANRALVVRRADARVAFRPLLDAYAALGRAAS